MVDTKVEKAVNVVIDVGPGVYYQIKYLPSFNLEGTWDKFWSNLAQLFCDHSLGWGVPFEGHFIKWGVCKEKHFGEIA